MCAVVGRSRLRSWREGLGVGLLLFLRPMCLAMTSLDPSCPIYGVPLRHFVTKGFGMVENGGDQLLGFNIGGFILSSEGLFCEGCTVWIAATRKKDICYLLNSKIFLRPVKLSPT